MMKATHVVQKVYSTETVLKEAVANFNVAAGPHSDVEHYMRSSPLRHGKTVWLRKGLDENRENTELFLNAHILTLSVGLLLGGRCRVGRAYIHRLQPGQRIDRHNDSEQTYYYRVERYQVYLNKPEGMVIYHDGPDIEAGHLMYFNHFAFHEYINNSNEDFYLLVFDLEREREVP